MSARLKNVKRGVRLVVAIGLLTVGLSRQARGGEDALRIEYATRVSRGQAPKLRLHAQEPIGSVRVELLRADGKVVRAGVDGMAKGAVREVALPAEPGAFRYEGTLTVGQGGVSQVVQVAFEAVVAEPLVLSLDPARVDLEAGAFEVTASRPPRSAHVVVTGMDGTTLADTEIDLTGKAAGEPVRVSFGKVEKEIARIEVRLTDVQGYFAGVALHPWSVYIPHEEVQFALDSAQIERTEEPKLRASLGLIFEALRKHEGLGPVKLFIAGHTDTQGSPAHNRDLSLRRARAIAQYFRKAGLRIPVLYEGFGEHAPKVGTADETDEPRNRRVDYILAVEPPTLRSSGFSVSWKTLR